MEFLALHARLAEAKGGELRAARERLLNGIARLKVRHSCLPCFPLHNPPRETAIGTRLSRVTPRPGALPTPPQDTNEAVDRMQRQLNELQPLLAQKTAAAQKLLAQVTQEQADAVAVATVVASEESEVAAWAVQTQRLKDEAEADLAAALPALEAATKVGRIARGPWRVGPCCRQARLPLPPRAQQNPSAPSLVCHCPGTTQTPTGAGRPQQG